MPTAPLKVSSSTSQSVGCVCTIMESSLTVVPAAMALEHSWIRSEACSPMMCTPSTLPVSLLKRHLAIPVPSSSASALELALKEPVDLPSVKPSFSAFAFAWSSVRPTIAISGCVKHAAGMQSWSTAWWRPTMFSTAEMPWAEAACASIILPLASPMHHTPGITVPSCLSSTCILSFTCTKPRKVSMPFSSRPMSLVAGMRPVHTSAASTNIGDSGISSLVLASTSLIFTGFSPSTPGVTSTAKTDV
mmetsp:Transcript_63053/g.150420  ORF Transcript_63053/g.150420 Transcript_63053/m.150420 type:complete len:247 (+) Transcript_63053:365-1105(+)